MKVKMVRAMLVFSLYSAYAVSSLLMSGCATTSGIEASGTVLTDNNPSGLYTSIVINNSSLAGDLDISGMKSENSGDLLRIQVSLRSKNRDSVAVQYKFNWFDVKGFEINANPAWTPLLVYGKETVTIQGVAPDQRAKEFKLKIRAKDESE